MSTGARAELSGFYYNFTIIFGYLYCAVRAPSKSDEPVLLLNPPSNWNSALSPNKKVVH